MTANTSISRTKARDGTEDADFTKGTAPIEPQKAKPPISLILGHVVGLAMSSPLHRNITLAELALLVAPPLQLNQYRLLSSDGQIVGYLSWARVSDEVSKKLSASMLYRLQPNEWQSGNNHWVIDFIGPESLIESAMRVVRSVAPTFAFKAHVASFQTRTAHIQEFPALVS